jgi:hypothetical protein
LPGVLASLEKEVNDRKARLAAATAELEAFKAASQAELAPTLAKLKAADDVIRGLRESHETPPSLPTPIGHSSDDTDSGLDSDPDGYN